MDEAERCDYLMIQHGIALAEGTPAALKQRYTVDTIEQVFFESGADARCERWQSLDGSFKQMLRDKRTLALMFFGTIADYDADVFLISKQHNASSKLGCSSCDQSVVNVIDTKNVTIHHYDSSQSTEND